MGRLITEARVVAALDRFDLALVLWAVRSPSRARVLWVLLDGPATAKEIIRRTGIQQVSAHRALKRLMGVRLVVSLSEIQGVTGPRARVYEIAPGGKRNDDMVSVS